MKLITLASRRWNVISPSIYILAEPGPDLYLFFDGAAWGVCSAGYKWSLARDRDTAAMRVHEELCHGP